MHTDIKIRTIPLPSPSPGTERAITVYTYGDCKIGPKVYIQTALHADEIPGMLLIHHLHDLLRRAAEEDRMQGQFVVVPVANPIGMAQRVQGDLCGRLDLNNGKNYNRYFPDISNDVAQRIDGKLKQDATQNTQTIREAMRSVIADLPQETESEAYRKVLMSLSADSDICIDLHCDFEAVLHMYSGHSHSHLVESLSAQLGCEVLLLAQNSGGSPFDEAISEIWDKLALRFPDYPIHSSCMGCTIELRGKADVSDELAQNDALNIYQFFVNHDIIAGKKQPHPTPLCQPSPLEGLKYVSSPGTGVLIYKKSTGEWVEKDDLIAVLLDPVEQGQGARTEILAPISGKVFARSQQRLVGPGQIIMSIAGSKILAERTGGHLLSD